MAMPGNCPSTGSTKIKTPRTRRRSFTSLVQRRLRKLANRFRARRRAVGLAAAGLGGVALLTGPSSAHAAMITQFEPTVGQDFNNIDSEYTNNDNGAVYDSAEVNLFSGLAEELQGLDVNAGQSISDLVSQWNISVRAPPTGEVYNGWSAVVGADGQIGLSSSGRGADAWLSTAENPNLDTLALTVGVPTSQLELNGIAGYQPESDARVVLGVDGSPNAFVGNEGGAGYGAAGNNYHVVPEPTTGIMLGAVMGAAVAKKKVGELASKVRSYFSRS
jgi:hypothetical protein